MSRKCPICNGELEDDAVACPRCGFRMLGATQSFTPIKVDSTDETVQRPIVKQRELRVVRGPQTGMNIELNEGVLTMGRDPKCDIFLNDMTVSRKHATLEVDERGCVIRDSNSFNGVWVNDRSVEACLLKSDDILQLGAFCLVYKERQQ